MKKIIVFGFVMFFGLTSVFALSSSISNGVNSIIAGTNVTVSPTGGQGNVTINASAGGGLPDTTTFYFELGSGGDVYVSSNSFEASPGVFKTAITTFTITGYQAYHTVSSTVGVTNYKIAYTTSTGADIAYSYVTPDTSVPASNKYSAWVSTNITVNFGDKIAVHNTLAQTAGTLAAGWGMRFKAWRFWKAD